MARSKRGVAITGSVPSFSTFSSESSILVRECGLEFSCHISFERWEHIGGRLLAVASSSAWWIADWLLYGEDTYLDRYQEAARKTYLGYQTLRNYTWVARQFELPRRRAGLSFSHHAEVASLTKSEQDYWLRKAEELNWSRNQLRRQVQISLHERGGQRNATEQASERRTAAAVVQRLSVKLTTDQFRDFSTIANSLNLSVEDWAIKVLTEAAG